LESGAKGQNVDYIVETDFEGPNFVMVPNAVARSGRLSAEALGVLVYMASLPRGYLVRVGCIQEAFAMGKDRWQRIARELRACGAMQMEAVRGPGGRVIGRRVVVRWPNFEAAALPPEPDQAAVSTESRETRPSDRKPGFPTVGKPAKVGGETRQSGRRNPAPYKEQTKKTGGDVAKPRQSSVSVCDLSPFQRSRLLAGQSVVIAGQAVAAGSAQAEKLRFALRSDCLDEKGSERKNRAEFS
jgi:hypothetical protein